MTVSRRSNIHEPYGLYFVPPTLATKRGLPVLQLPYDRETILKEKRSKGILWFVSNCETPSKREILVKELAR
jgi:hypothetical protein